MAGSTLLRSTAWSCPNLPNKNINKPNRPKFRISSSKSENKIINPTSRNREVRLKIAQDVITL